MVVHQSASLGLIVTDRNTVSVSVGDITISFGAHPAEVPGRIAFLHPTHNFAIVSYKPADLPAEVLALPKTQRFVKPAGTCAYFERLSVRRLARTGQQVTL